MKDTDPELSRALAGRIRELPPAEPPPWLAEAVMRRLDDRAPKRRLRLGWLLPPKRAFIPALAAASLLAAFAGGMLVQSLRTAPTQPAVPFSRLESGAQPSFLLGRGLLAAGQPEAAVEQLARAVRLEPLRADYRLWLGRALGRLDRTAEAVEQYRQAAALDRSTAAPRLELARSLLRNGQAKLAAAEYGRVLHTSPRQAQALLGRAEALVHLGRDREAARSLKRLLSLDISGWLAVEAAKRLNALGDFTYRPALIGRRRMALRTPTFEDGRLRPETQDSLRRVAETLSRSPGLVLHVVAFAEGNKPLAKRRALRVKRALAAACSGLSGRRIRTSWFGSPEPIRPGSGGRTPSESIRIFGVLEATT